MKLEVTQGQTNPNCMISSILSLNFPFGSLLKSPGIHILILEIFLGEKYL